MSYTRGRAKGLALLAAALAGALSPVWGLSLRNSASELALGEVKPGRTVPLAQLVHGPLRVTNTGNEGATVDMAFAAPGAGELKDGYEPVPDLAWLRFVGRPGASAAPGADVQANALVSVPRQAGLAGGQYQAQWVSAATSESGLKLELRSRVLIRVAAEDDGLEAARRAAVKRGGVEFQLAADRGQAEGVALGRRVDLRAGHGTALKMANVGETTVTVALRVLAEGFEEAPAQKGFTPAPNPAFAGFERRTLEIAPGTIAEPGLWVNIPDQARYRGRRWVFRVEAEALEAVAGARKTYWLFVSTKEGSAR